MTKAKTNKSKPIFSQRPCTCPKCHIRFSWEGAKKGRKKGQCYWCYSNVTDGAGSAK